MRAPENADGPAALGRGGTGDAGSHLIAQIQDPGAAVTSRGASTMPSAPSALPDDLSWTVPHALTTNEVEQMVDEFAESAQILQQAGFSGVEISAGHGHLFHQFMARRSNLRTDRYGGDRSRAGYAC